MEISYKAKSKVCQIFCRNIKHFFFVGPNYVFYKILIKNYCFLFRLKIFRTFELGGWSISPSLDKYLQYTCLSKRLFHYSPSTWSVQVHLILKNYEIVAKFNYLHEN